MNKVPSLSVVLPVRNAARYLDASIGSLAGQTFRDFELVILDDASSDGSDRLLQLWARQDARIRLHRVDRPLGIVGSSNFVVGQARAPLVARMDADDISHPERMSRQWDLMRSRPEVGLVGTLCDGIDAEGCCVRPRDRWRLLRRSPFPPFPHGSVMFRREIFHALGGYRQECAGWEDQDLFLRFGEKAEVAVLPEVLYHYRYHADSAVASASGESAERVEALRRLCIAERRAGRDYTPLLASSPPAAKRAHALRSAAGIRLWAGHPPAVLVPMLRRGATAPALLWAAWASLHPGSLKTISRWLIRARDLAAGWVVRDRKAYRWRYP
jgi:glycosyltransferase involved in cell wall biosynthesis